MSEKILIQDNDCHWYIISTKDVNDFNEWVKWMEDCDIDSPSPSNKDYDNNSIDGPHSIIIHKYSII